MRLFVAIGLALLLSLGGASHAAWAEDDPSSSPTPESSIPPVETGPSPSTEPPIPDPESSTPAVPDVPADPGVSNPTTPRITTPNKNAKTPKSTTPAPPVVDAPTPSPSVTPKVTPSPTSTPSSVTPELWNTNYTESNTPAGQSMLAIIALIGSLVLAALLGGGAFLYKKLLADRLPRKPFSRGK